MAREMKDSGIAWIGEIPEEWEVGTIGMFFDEINNPNTNQEETNTLQFKMGDIISKKNGDSKYNPETIAAYNVVEPGTIMINGLNLSFDLVSQRVAQVHEKGAITSTYLAMMPKNGLQSDYAMYMLKAYDNCKALHSMGRGLRATLSYSSFRTEPIFLPPLPEQRAIATFLDEKCGEIDELVALQEKMIEELKAYKQAVITETVTKGLDTNVKMKDSGVEWIGQIPEEWKVVPITKYLESLVDYRGKTPNKVENGIQLITARNIKNGIIDYELSKEYVKEDEYEDIMHRGKPQIGDVLFTTEAPLGNTANVDRIDIALAQRIIKFRPNSLLNPYFLKYWIMGDGFQQFLLTLSTGSTASGIKGSKLFMLITTLPPLPEQHAIATYLDTKCADIDALISIKQKKIEELKNYKKSLIYEYVTGKKQIC